MPRNPHPYDLSHPLLAQAQRARLDEILDIMYAKIHRTLFPWTRRIPARGANPRRSENGDDVELTLDGTGVSAEDVLAEALDGLLRRPQHGGVETWKGLAIRIAENKAYDALRATGKGLRGTDHRQQLHLVPGDVERQTDDGATQPALLQLLPANWGDPEAEYVVTGGALKLLDLARQTLDGQEQEVFLAIHFEGCSRTEVGGLLGLTGQRIGQIYSAALHTLEAHSDYPFKPPIEIGQSSKGGTDD